MSRTHKGIEEGERIQVWIRDKASNEAMIIVTMFEAYRYAFSFDAWEVTSWSVDMHGKHTEPSRDMLDAEDHVTGLLKFDGSLHIYAEYLMTECRDLADFYGALSHVLWSFAPDRTQEEDNKSPSLPERFVIEVKARAKEGEVWQGI